MISNMLVSPSAWPVLRLPGWRRSVTDQSGSCSWSVTGTGLRLSFAGRAGVRLWIVNISVVRVWFSIFSTGSCGFTSTVLPPRTMTIGAASISVCAVAGSMERRFVASMVRCLVRPDTWAVSTSFRCVTDELSASPARTMTGPRSPASTDTSGRLTPRTSPASLFGHSFSEI